MATILFTWELGGGLGHLQSIRPLAEAMLADGHRVVLALRNLTYAEKVFEQADVVYLQAPAKPENLTPEFQKPATFAQILMNVGLGKQQELRVLCKAWQSIFDYVQPDLVVCDHSPTAMLTARNYGFPCVTIGTGFSCPASCHPLPNWRPWEDHEPQRISQDEDRLLAVMNDQLATWELPTLECVTDLYQQVDHAVLVTYPELDPFGQRPQAQYYGNWPEAPGVAPQWPSGKQPRVFLYLRQLPSLQPVLQTIQRLKLAAIARIPGDTLQLRQTINAKNVVIEDRFVDIDRVAQECDLAIVNATHVMTASILLAGKPVLMLPPFLEQLLTAQRVVDMGAGIIGNANQGHLQAAILELYGNDRHRNAAQQFAARYADVDRQSRLEQAVDELRRRLP